MPVDWSLLQMGNPAGAFQAGLENGRQQARGRQLEGALSAYAQNPADQGALSAVIAADPRTGLALAKDSRDQMRTEAIGTTAQAAVGGDQSARYKLWGLAPEIAAKLDARQHTSLEEGMKAIGQVAYRVALLPPNQRAQAWDEGVTYLSQAYPETAKYKGQYSDANLNGVLAQTGMTEKVQGAIAPDYVVAPPGGGLINKNPLSPGFNPTVGAAPQGVSSLPPGFTLDGGAPSQGGATFP